MVKLSVWIDASQPVPPEENMVAVWRVPIGSGSQDSGDRYLSVAEKQKAARFHFDRDRIRYQQSHAALRWLLGMYLNIAPNQIEFSTNPYGKPSIRVPGESRLNFNLSHAGDLALMAFAWNIPLGIDIERMRPDLVDPLIARRYFAPSETEKLFSLPEEQRLAGFFNCWTRKEAYVKGRGLGLSLPLESFTVTLEPGQEEVALASFTDLEETSHWQIRPLDPGSGYSAAVAVRAHSWKLTCFQFKNCYQNSVTF